MRQARPEIPWPLAHSILRALLRDWTVWCDDGKLRLRARDVLTGEPRRITWAEAARLAAIATSEYRARRRETI